MGRIKKYRDFQRGKELHSATPSFRSFPLWKVREKNVILENKINKLYTLFGILPTIPENLIIKYHMTVPK